MKVGFTGDIHEDILNLKKAFSLLEEYGCTEFYDLGDFVGAFPKDEHHEKRDPNAVVEMLRERCKATVIGNHDLSIIRKLPQEMPEGVHMPENYFDLSIEERKKASGWGSPDHPHGMWEVETNMFPADLKPDNEEWMRSLPEVLTCELDGWSCALMHTFRPNPTGYGVLFPHERHGGVSVLNMQMEWQRREGIQLTVSAHAHVSGLAVYRIGDDEIRKAGFNQSVSIDREVPTWVSITSVKVSGSHAGVTVFDTAEGTMVSLPL